MAQYTLKGRRHPAESGFTLIELLVVTVILIALSAIAIPVFLNQKAKADQAAEEATISRIGQFVSAGIASGNLDNGATTDGLIQGGTILSSQIGMVSTDQVTKGWYSIEYGEFCVSNGSYYYSSTSGGTQAGNCPDSPY